MVPTQSPSEWSTGENAFLNNISGMPGVSVRQCLPKADASIASFHWGVLYTKDPDNPYLHHGMEEIFFDGHWSPYPIELYWQALGIPNDYLWQGITPSSPPRGYCRLKDGSPAVKIIDDSSNAFFLASRGDDWAEEGRGMARPEGTFWRARLKSWRDNYFDIAMEDVLTPDQGICTVIVTFDSAWTWNINNDFYKGPAKSVAGFTYYVAAPSGILPDERGVYFPPYVD